MGYGEISYDKLFRTIDSEIETKENRILNGSFPDYESYLKEVSAYRAVKSLRDTFQTIADKAHTEDSQE